MNRCCARMDLPAALTLTGLVGLFACAGPKARVGEDAGPQCSVAGDAAVEKATLTEIAKAMLAFHTDTGGWPYGETAWYAITPPWRSVPDSEIDGAAFNSFDTALFAQPPDILPCDSTHTGGYNNPCWKGPYLMGSATDSLGTAPWLDQWCNPMMFGYIRPNDGNGGGINLPGATNGLIYIWSTGPDGVDCFMCTPPTADQEPTCALNVHDLAAGLPSQSSCDDIVQEVANNSQ